MGLAAITALFGGLLAWGFWAVDLWIFPRGMGLLPWWLVATLIWLVVGNRPKLRMIATLASALFWPAGGYPLWGPASVMVVAVVRSRSQRPGVREVSSCYCWLRSVWCLAIRP